MGIRVHKCIGYGLTDVKTDKKDQLIDDRFDPLGYLYADFEDREATWTPEGWVTYYKNHVECPWQTGFYKEKHYQGWDFDEIVIHETEYGLPNVLLLMPPLEHKSWRRYDDIIDYTEESARPRGQVNRFEVLNAGIWPHTARYTDLRTNKPADRLAHDFWFSVRSAIQASRRRRPVHMENARNYAERMGFASVAEAEYFLAPEVPEEIQLMCKFLCLFSDEDTIYQLRPMIYVYWG